MFVGNLSYEITREELLEAFSAAGKVVDAKVPTDRETGRPRGFAFVEFEDEETAQKSISLMNGKELKGRPLRVNEAENRPPRAPGSSGPSFRPGPRGPASPSQVGFRDMPEIPARGEKPRNRRFSKPKEQKEGRREERRRNRRGGNDLDDY